MMNMPAAKPASAVEVPNLSMVNSDMTAKSSRKLVAIRKFSRVITKKLLAHSLCPVTVFVSP